MINDLLPSWSQLSTFIECEYFWLDDDDEEKQLPITALEISELSYNFSLTCPQEKFESIALNKRLWFVYKPDFSIYTWFRERPEEISQSGLVQIEITEKDEDYHKQCSSIQISVKAKIVDILTFGSIADRFIPKYSGEPYPLLKNLMNSELANSCDVFKNHSGYSIKPRTNLPSGYEKITNKDLTFINFCAIPSDYIGWIIIQKRQEYERPVLVAYTEITGDQSTFVGHRPLTTDEWLFFERWERQCLGIDQINKEAENLFCKLNNISPPIKETFVHNVFVKIKDANYDYW
jgi:hypothetical protein